MTTKLKRILFTPSDEVASAVQELEDGGKTKSDILNKAVLIEKALREAASNGGAVYIEQPNGDREKIIFIG